MGADGVPSGECSRERFGHQLLSAVDIADMSSNGPQTLMAGGKVERRKRIRWVIHGLFTNTAVDPRTPNTIE